MPQPRLSPYISFSREEWGALRFATQLTLSEVDLARLQGINERVSLEEVATTYLPLSRLLSLYVSAARNLSDATAAFLGRKPGKVPYVLGIAGSVAVGKSTTARIIQALVTQWPTHPTVDLVTTDGFLYPNEVLMKRGLMKRKGFPESYDVRKLLEFLADVKSGCKEVVAPVYSHLSYDIIPDEQQVIRQPDILIVEGLNVLQSPRDINSSLQPKYFVADFFDFSIYVHAEEIDIEQWYIDRFEVLRQTAFRQPASYFHRYADLTESEARVVGQQIWRTINAVNLRENILPTLQHAKLILEKGPNHAVQTVQLRKL